MKLYTEEQVRKAIDEARNYYDGWVSTEQGIIDSLTPIELPSDEEIEVISKDEILYNDSKRAWWVEGAKWMRDKILNKGGESATVKNK